MSSYPLLDHGDASLVHSQCPANFNSAAIDSRFCYRFDPTGRTWSEAYDYCRHSLPDGNLMEISSFHQWQALTKAEINQQSLVWIGANRFGRGKTIDRSILKSKLKTDRKNFFLDRELYTIR